jgi:hypothetical protein
VLRVFVLARQQPRGCEDEDRRQKQGTRNAIYRGSPGSPTPEVS